MPPSLSPRSSANLRSAVKSSTRSHGMCSETERATPVNASTWAASSSFSYGSRATPGWENTLNRVPELPNAHDGISIHWRLSSSLMLLMSSSPSGSGEVEDLRDRLDALVGPLIAEPGEE